MMSAALLGAAACAGGPGKPAPLNPVRFLLVNDVYVADTMADGNGGLARVATVRRRLADQGPVLFVLAGDVLSPSLLSKYSVSDAELQRGSTTPPSATTSSSCARHA
jgi:2',3'-cyclic-nucleotide 2'-phosphodiesterase (5'-nucleotidase family)